MRRFLNLIATSLALLFMTASISFATEAMHKVAIHVDQNDKKIMNMALNNVQNLNNYYQAKGESVIIELVAYGPGLHMFREDTSPVKSRLETMSLAMDNLQFSACGNTHAKMSKKLASQLHL